MNQLLIELLQHPCWTGGGLILIAVALRHIIRRRQFYRRNAQGLQTFRSYGRSVVIPLIERMVNMMALLLLLSGVVLLITGLINGGG